MTTQTVQHMTAIDALLSHVSIRKYTDQPIDEATLQQILDAARRAPTSSNTQTYSIVVVRDAETKRKLAVLTGNQKHVETSAVFMAFVADLSRLKRANALHDADLAINNELSMVAIVDASLVGMAAQVAAESLGLGTVMIGGARNQPEEIAQLLHLPEGAFIVYGMCIGWPAERPPQKPRLPEAEVVHYERYQQPDDGLLHAYDAALAAHYRGEGRETPDAAWTSVMARQFNQPRRPFLRAVLEKLGFNFN
ncbi:MAG: oxygen-insensitive NADPH nitroreductase [Pleurocapsa minor GSE-CHR-MK-17-07R]|jgi:nitroreductase|nr:oxygen-insensitive NADPH nitroreductase [Pleurocapsa minor GSE-CHR-MK 17-07R]